MSRPSATEESEGLHARVRAFVRGQSREGFDDLALALAAFQVQFVPAVARLHQALGCDLSEVALLPAMPCDAFRSRRLAVHHAHHDERLFYTSGTTAHQRGVHAFRTTQTYELAALTWARRWLLMEADTLEMWQLAPTEREAPHSSLSFMLERFAENVAGPRTCFWSEDELAVERLCSASSERPVLLAGTSFAFVHACDRLRDAPLRLPAGSRCMQTGGFKGRSREVEPDVLRADIAHCFGIDEACVVGEYGMTELSSQLYQGSLVQKLGHGSVDDPRSYHPPPWLRISAVDPVSLRSVEPGEEGLARIVDLANVDSSLVIQTQDRVVELSDGSVQLLGRAQGAMPRGCSLALEHLLT